ncbi:hypothetical protein RF037_15445, partial [Serratia marcescens]|nr:hypothetical protein [Serratia marcescens]
EHGSWDRSPLNGYRVSYVAFEQGKPVGKLKAVVTGFVSDDEKELYGAPVGLAIDITEHRVVDVERNHRQIVGAVGSR